MRSKHRQWLPLLAASLLLSWGLVVPRSSLGQQPPPAIKKEVALVSVDVVVGDKSGKPVRGLRREDFEVKEDGKPQEIAFFASEVGTAAREAPPPLPPHVYTNRPEYHPPREPLTIVLLDSLNTARVDQARMREEVIHFLSSTLKSDQYTAIFALTSQLLVLQDFTSDRRLLLAAAKKFTPQQSAALGIREHLTSRETRDEIEVLRQEAKAGLGPEFIPLLQRLEDDVTNLADRERAKITLSALRILAGGVVGYPGRKNLVWVSGSFPVYFAPTFREINRTGHSMSEEDDLTQTVRLLNNARVAIYPVDPRGLLNPTEPETYAEAASRVAQMVQQNGPQDPPRNPINYLRVSQGTLNSLAENTGGQAFYNRNDIEHAVALAVADGTSYYTLGYYPDNSNWDGRFRNIEVRLARKGLHLRFRKGYFAVGPARPNAQPTAEGQITAELQAALNDPVPATGVLFRAQVPPPQAAAPARVRVEFWLDKNSFHSEDSPGVVRWIDMDYVVAAFAPDGQMVNSAAKRVNWPLKPADYAQVLGRGLLLPVSVELPPGDYVLRLLLRDNRTGQLGRVDVPLALPSPANAPAP